jgi:hypothetical protein
LPAAAVLHRFEPVFAQIMEDEKLHANGAYQGQSAANR